MLPFPLRKTRVNVSLKAWVHLCGPKPAPNRADLSSTQKAACVRSRVIAERLEKCRFADGSKMSLVLAGSTGRGEWLVGAAIVLAARLTGCQHSPRPNDTRNAHSGNHR